MNVTGGANKRRSSHRFEAAQKRRKSKSIGTKLEGDEMLKATTKLTVDGHGNAHAESILEAIPASDAKKLKRAVRKSRESRGEAAHLAAAAVLAAALHISSERAGPHVYVKGNVFALWS